MPERQNTVARMRRLGSMSLLTLSCLAIAGCGTRSPNVQVNGRVVVEQGAPLDEGRLMLIPDPPDENRQTAGATIQKDGTFVCYSNSGGEGIPPGRYKVVLAFASGKGNINPFTKAFEQYTKVESTSLVIDVLETGAKDVVLELKEPEYPAPLIRNSTNRKQARRRRHALEHDA